MKTYFLTLFSLLCITIPAWARLGETGDQVVARYGDPLSQIEQKGIGNKIPLTILTFQKNGFEVAVSLSDGISSMESFRKLNDDPLTVEEVRILLRANAQGLGWEAPQMVENEKVWTRDDGSEARLVGGRILYIESKGLMVKTAVAQKLANAPSLQGF